MKKRILYILLSFAIIIAQLSPALNLKAMAESYPKASVRVEGLSGTIAEGDASGKNALDIFEKVMDKNKIPYGEDSSKTYITSIDNIGSGDYGGMSGWMYYVKDQNNVIIPMVGMNQYIPENGDMIIVYFGDFMSTSILNKITFTPNVVKENEQFKMKFNYSHFDYMQNKNIDTPIANAGINIDNLTYVTDNNGEITVPGLKFGEHTYKISGYNIDKTPSVVMDKGIFKIDNVNPPILNHSDSAYDDLYNSNNNKEIKNIDSEIKNTSGYIERNQESPWAAISLNKLRLKIDESFLNEYVKDIKENGIADYSNTELEKLILSLTAAGYSPYDFTGRNLISELFGRNIGDFLINDDIFGMFVYSYTNAKDGGYPISREKLKDDILKKAMRCKFEGKYIYGWSLMGGNMIDPDITGAALNALSPYIGDTKVKDLVDKAVKSLAAIENESGYLPGIYDYSSESLSFAITGLTSVGIDPEGALFKKAKGDLFSALLSYKGKDGQFKHSKDGADDFIATEEALRALIALKEYKKSGKYDFYSSNIDAKTLPVYNYNNANPDENSGSDIQGHASTAKKEAGKDTVPTSVPSTSNGVPSVSASTNIEIASGNNEQVTGTTSNEPLMNNTEDILYAIKNTDGNITVDASNNSIIDKSIFDAISGLNRSITFEYGDISWTFNGADIKNAAKDVNIALNDTPEYKNKIISKYGKYNIFIISFMDNGILPGKAEVKIKPDSKWLEGRSGKDLYLYYFNPDSGSAEKIEGPLKEDMDGFVTIGLTHCSDYFLTDSGSLVDNAKKASLFNTTTVAAGILIILGGITAALLLIKRGKQA
ncbi:MAG: DUF4430 domain-containing protein [Clostridiales bacterium]|nr:DUF4430 domain-containing protein [Clostridiales bacterium]